MNPIDHPTESEDVNDYPVKGNSMKVTFNKSTGKAKECPTMEEPVYENFWKVDAYSEAVCNGWGEALAKYKAHLASLKEYEVSSQLKDLWSKDSEGKVYEEGKEFAIWPAWDYDSDGNPINQRDILAIVNPIPQEAGHKWITENVEPNLYMTREKYLAAFKAGAAHTGEGDAVDLEFTEWVAEKIMWDEITYMATVKMWKVFGNDPEIMDGNDLYQLFKQSKAIKP